MLLRHQAGARLVGQYDFNNTYQYIVNRDETQLSWVATAIDELGGTISDQPEPDRGRSAEGRGAAASSRRTRGTRRRSSIAGGPASTRCRTPGTRKMLRLILGEVLEQKRFFDQALAGRTDLLGRRGASLGPSHGEVLPSRWIE